MRKKFGVVLVITALTLSLLLSGCQPAVTVVEDEPMIVRRAQWNPPTGMFHPELLSSDYDSSVTALIFEQLVEMNPNLEFEPALAESWEFSEDNLSCTFNLRKNVKWHDGQPFTAEDVKFSLMFVGHQDYKGARYSNVSSIVGMEAYHAGESLDVEGIEIIDTHTIKITTSEVFAPFLLNIGGRIMTAKHIWGDVEVATAEEQTELLRNPVGTGPFKFEEFVPDQYASVVANDKYWAGRPKVDGIVIQSVNQDTAMAQMLNDEIDIMTVTSFNPDDMAMYEENDIQVLKALLVAVQYMGINHEKEFLQNKLIRQAFSHAINRQGIVDELLYGYGEVADNPFPPSIWAYPPQDEITHYEYNPERAIALMQEAGCEYTDGIMYYAGQPVELSLLYPYGNKVREQYAQVIHQNMADIGVTIDLQIMEFATLSDKCEAGEFDLYLMGIGTSFDADQRYIWGKNSRFNYGRYFDETSIAMMEEGVKYTEVEKRKDIYLEWAKHMNEQVPNVWIYNWYSAVAVTPKLQNVQFFPGGVYYDVINWEFK